MNRRRQRPVLACARFSHPLGLACAALTFGLGAGSVAQTTPTSVLTEPSEPALRQAMTNGGWIVIACDGTFALSGTINVATNTVLDGTGHSVTLRGGSYVQVLSVSPEVTLTLSNLTIQGGWAFSGGGVLNNGTLNVVACVFSENTAQGQMGLMYTGGPGGNGNGGAICNFGRLNVNACTFVNNRAMGGVGGSGTHGQMPGPFDPPPLPGALDGGPGGPGGAGNGGAIFSAGTAAIVNSTFVGNSGSGGMGGPGGGAGNYAVFDPYSGQFHIVYGSPGPQGIAGPAVAAISGDCALTNCTLVQNVVFGGGPALAGPALVNTLLAANTPEAVFTDAGHNLVLAETNDMVGPLNNNGGPTPTMALLPGSPAIGAADSTSAPPADQRGFPRRVGTAVDIGAYQYLAGPVLAVSRSRPDGLTFRIYATPGDSVRLLTSTDLTHWTVISTNEIPGDGISSLPLVPIAGPNAFFRLASP
ncbi:MAG TPA: choice-of-anchor Q domain-containing protein [Verrucomicrobiae bacterium]